MGNIEGGYDRSGQNHLLNQLLKATWNAHTNRTCQRIQLINKTGIASIYGEIVIASIATDYAFALSGIDEEQPIGSVYESGVADGSLCWIVVSGSAQVLLEDATLSTHGNWVYTSGVAGRADATLGAPPGGAFPQIDNHMRELGHCIESKGADVDVLAEIIMHLN